MIFFNYRESPARNHGLENNGSHPVRQNMLCCITDFYLKKFNSNFGLLDLACLFRYSTSLNAMLKSPANAAKKIKLEKNIKGACIIGSFNVISQKIPKEAYKLLTV